VELRASGLAQMGDTVVITGGMPVARRAQTNFIKLHRIGDS
jgi:pyruvate kinase